MGIGKRPRFDSNPPLSILSTVLSSVASLASSVALAMAFLFSAASARAFNSAASRAARASRAACSAASRLAAASRAFLSASAFLFLLSAAAACSRLSFSALAAASASAFRRASRSLASAILRAFSRAAASAAAFFLANSSARFFAAASAAAFRFASAAALALALAISCSTRRSIWALRAASFCRCWAMSPWMVFCCLRNPFTISCCSACLPSSSSFSFLPLYSKSFLCFLAFRSCFCLALTCSCLAMTASPCAFWKAAYCLTKRKRRYICEKLSALKININLSCTEWRRRMKRMDCMYFALREANCASRVLSCACKMAILSFRWLISFSMSSMFFFRSPISELRAKSSCNRRFTSC